MENRKYEYLGKEEVYGDYRVKWCKLESKYDPEFITQLILFENDEPIGYAGFSGFSDVFNKHGIKAYSDSIMDSFLIRSVNYG